jgi:hypothetical protein
MAVFSTEGTKKAAEQMFSRFPFPPARLPFVGKAQDLQEERFLFYNPIVLFFVIS